MLLPVIVNLFQPWGRATTAGRRRIAHGVTIVHSGSRSITHAGDILTSILDAAEEMSRAFRDVEAAITIEP
jgi:hypothetical protein